MVTTDPAVRRIIDAIRDHGCGVKESGDRAVTQCPSHADDNPSLSIGPRSDGRGAVLHCHAGCHYTDILAELHLTESDMFSDDGIVKALYPVQDYEYSGGRKKHRSVSPEGKKTFWQEGTDDKSLYVPKGIDVDDRTIYLCEGEKGADVLQELGYAAVATGGSQCSCDLTPLTRRDVVVIADRDKAGYDWAIRNTVELSTIARSVKIVQAKIAIDKADIVEHIAAGFSVEDLEPVVAPQTNGHKEELTEQEKTDLHALAVARKAYELRLVDEGRTLWNRQRAELMGQQPPKMVNMIDFLAIPDPEIRYRIEDLIPAGGRVLLAAQYKAGKTSLIANLLRSLVDGDPFLGKFATNTVPKVLLIDTELDEDMLRRWLRAQNIRNMDGINILPLRGKLSTFNIVDDATRAEWAQRIMGAQIVLLDCLRPCLDAIGLSEDKEAGVFLVAFDALCKECGANEAVVVHHMGHSMERSRGDSRLLDWPDVLWKIVRDTDEDGEDIESGDRFFSAVGRDVMVPESQLDWQPETRALMICGGNRIDKKARSIFDDIIEILSNPDYDEGLGRNDLVKKLRTYGHSLHLARAALRHAVEDRLLIIKKGPRNSNVHIINPSHLNQD